MRNIPNKKQLANYNVNRPGWEAIRQSLYDFTTYAAAGQTQLTFFALPVGQGGKTLSDTNMTLAGQLPANQEFLVNSVEIYFRPTTPAPSASTADAAVAAPALATAINDSYLVSRTGNLTFVIGSKPYLQEAPLGRFPPKTNFEVDAALALATTVAADSIESRIAISRWTGRPYLLSPADLRLVSTQNFNVTLNWPEGVQAITNAARIGVVLDGILYRRSQ